MRHASKSTYLALHTILSLLGRVVTGAPLLTTSLLPQKRAIAEGLGTGAIVGYVLIIALLVVLSGITAGLTLGLMSLDETQRIFLQAAS